MPDVTLIRPHTHAGSHHEAGDTITVTPAEQKWLAARQVIAPDTPVKHSEEDRHE